MNLTALVKQPAVRERIAQDIPRPRMKPVADLLVPRAAKGDNPQLMGTAYDYLLRFHLLRDFPFAAEGRWVPENWHDQMVDMGEQLPKELETWRNELRRITRRARRQQASFCGGEALSMALLRTTIQLADCEMYIRAGLPMDRLRQPSAAQAKELARLIEVTNWSLLRPKRRCLLNPTFGNGDCPVSADADLLIDDMLIEIKTVSKLQVTPEHWCQLIGYAALNEHFPIGNGKRVPIRRVGIYFSRHAHLVSWSLNELVDKKRFTSFATWLLKFARDRRHGQHRAKLRGPGERARTTTSRKTAPKKASRTSR